MSEELAKVTKERDEFRELLRIEHAKQVQSSYYGSIEDAWKHHDRFSPGCEVCKKVNANG